jgi:plastocyanin
MHLNIDHRTNRRKLSGAVAAIALLAGCGHGDTTPSNAPSNTPSGGGTSTTTIVISNNAASPRAIVISRGTQVTFVNNDSRNHEMTSDPHPEHTDCPAINQVGPIVPGQSKQTGNLNTIRSCGFHDHNDPLNTNLQGRITIQ